MPLMLTWTIESHSRMFAKNLPRSSHEKISQRTAAGQVPHTLVR